MAHCGWCRPSLIWPVMLGETESTADWCLSNPLVGWLLASHTAGHRHSVCVGTVRWKNHYYCGLTSVVIKKRQSADGVSPIGRLQGCNLCHKRLWVEQYVSVFVHWWDELQKFKTWNKLEEERKNKPSKRVTFFSIYNQRWHLCTAANGGIFFHPQGERMYSASWCEERSSCGHCCGAYSN